MIILMILLNDSDVGDDEINAEHCDDSQVVVIMMVMARMMLLMRRALLIVFSTSGSKVFKLTVEILVREARGQVQASPKYHFFAEYYRHHQNYHKRTVASSTKNIIH